MIHFNNFLFLPALRFPPSIFPFPVHPLSLINANLSNLCSDPSQRKDQFAKSINFIPVCWRGFLDSLLFTILTRHCHLETIYFYFYFYYKTNTSCLWGNNCGKPVVTLLISSIISTQLTHTQNQPCALLSSRYNDFLNQCSLEIWLLNRPNSFQRETKFHSIDSTNFGLLRRKCDDEIVLKIASES
jgi:hypothetical protein